MSTGDEPPRHRGFFGRLFGPNEPSVPSHGAQLTRLEEKRRSLQKATDQWLALLREMEENGQSSQADYERYYAAYTEAKKQLKAIDLELFNYRTSQPG